MSLKKQRASKICKEWSLDFRQKNLIEMADFWLSMSKVVMTNAKVSGDGLDGAIRDCEIKLTMPDINTGMIEIKKEAEILLPFLLEMKG